MYFIGRSNSLESLFAIAYNEQGLALLGDLKNVRPELKPN
jgi:hypothetical protein